MLKNDDYCFRWWHLLITIVHHFQDSSVSSVSIWFSDILHNSSVILLDSYILPTVRECPVSYCLNPILTRHVTGSTPWNHTIRMTIQNGWHIGSSMHSSQRLNSFRTSSSVGSPYTGWQRLVTSSSCLNDDYHMNCRTTGRFPRLVLLALD